MRAALAAGGAAALPQVEQAVVHSTPAATFGRGSDQIVVRHIDAHPSPQPLSTGKK
jgi:hypothetical protein